MWIWISTAIAIALTVFQAEIVHLPFFSLLDLGNFAFRPRSSCEETFQNFWTRRY